VKAGGRYQMDDGHIGKGDPLLLVMPMKNPPAIGHGPTRRS
jgi:hypothetical protein